MKKKVNFSAAIAFLFLWSFIFPIAYSQVIIQDNQKIFSNRLGRNVNYSVMLPSDYFKTDKSFPVIYLLHGFGGDYKSWLLRCNIAVLVDSLLKQNEISEFIYIMPDAGNSYYINNYDSSVMYNDFFRDELVPVIDTQYRSLNRKEMRSVMGLSMGGFGSVILAVKNPDLFGNVVAFSPAVRNEEQMDMLTQRQYDVFFGPVYGIGLTGEGRTTDHWKDHSPYYLVDSASSGKYKDINWYIECGLGDPLLTASKSFHDLLLGYKIDHELHLRPGGHNWEFWYKSTISGLQFISLKVSQYQDESHELK